MRKFLKYFLHLLSIMVILPCALTSWIEARLSASSEEVFLFWGQLLAILPGMPGMFLRRAYYCLTLEQCSPHVHIGFSTLISHRAVILERDVYIGPFSLIGMAHIGPNCFIGSRVSIISGKNQHRRDSNGRWTPADKKRFKRVRIDVNVWVGEGALVMDDIGHGALVAAGAVVTGAVAPNMVVGGNPARTIRTLEAVQAKRE